MPLWRSWDTKTKKPILCTSNQWDDSLSYYWISTLLHHVHINLNEKSANLDVLIMILWISCKKRSLLRYPRFLWVNLFSLLLCCSFLLGGGGGCYRTGSTCGSSAKRVNKLKHWRAARQRILSDVITTRALYTPLVYVFSRGWSVTSTAVRFHFPVQLCGQSSGACEATPGESWAEARGAQGARCSGGRLVTLQERKEVEEPHLKPRIP